MCPSCFESVLVTSGILMLKLQPPTTVSSIIFSCMALLHSQRSPVLAEVLEERRHSCSKKRTLRWRLSPQMVLAYSVNYCHLHQHPTEFPRPGFSGILQTCILLSLENRLEHHLVAADGYFIPLQQLLFRGLIIKTDSKLEFQE